MYICNWLSFFFTIFKVAELAKEITRSKRVRIATDAVIIEDESQPKKKAKKGTGRKQKKQPNVTIWTCFSFMCLNKLVFTTRWRWSTLMFHSVHHIFDSFCRLCIVYLLLTITLIYIKRKKTKIFEVKFACWIILPSKPFTKLYVLGITRKYT